MTGDEYLKGVLGGYKPKNPNLYSTEISSLVSGLEQWAGGCYSDIFASGSRAKDTAVGISADLDIFISLKSSCNENSGGLFSIYQSLHDWLVARYISVRVQNVSFRIMLGDLKVDITPGRKHPRSSNYHSIYVSKKKTWTQTNPQMHNNQISQSIRKDEIKLLKIWRELNGLEFSSIYLEYLVIHQILKNRSSNYGTLAKNFFYVLSELAKDSSSPLTSRIVDPSNSNNILSDLLTGAEKRAIRAAAKKSIACDSWASIIY